MDQGIDLIPDWSDLVAAIPPSCPECGEWGIDISVGSTVAYAEWICKNGHKWRRAPGEAVNA